MSFADRRQVGAAGSRDRVRQVRADDDQAGQQRGEGGSAESLMCLEDSGQHDADAVEHDLRGEDPQHGCTDIDSHTVAEHEPCDGLGQQGDCHGDRCENDDRPCQQRRSRAVDVRAVVRLDGVCEQRYDEACECAAGHDLVQDVRDRVDGHVDAVEVRLTHGVGEDPVACEAGDPSEDGEHGDEGGGSEYGATPAGKPSPVSALRHMRSPLCRGVTWWHTRHRSRSWAARRLPPQGRR